MPEVSIQDVRIELPNGRVLTAWENYYRDLELYGEETADFNYEFIKRKAAAGVSTLCFKECDCEGCKGGLPSTCHEDEND